MKTRFVCLTLALLATAACRNPGEMDVVCTQEARPSIRVSVLDSISGVAAGKNSRIVAQAGTYTDSAPAAWTSASDGPYPVGFEHAGTFTITVSKMGYRDWSRTGIVVTADKCHVRTVDVTARLQQ